MHLAIPILAVGLAATINLDAELQDQIQISSSYNESMLWGTYRPNLYFGTRTRTKETLLSGIAWFGAASLDKAPWESKIILSCGGYFDPNRRRITLSLFANTRILDIIFV